MRDFGHRLSQHLLRALLRVMEHLGRVRSQLLAHDQVQVLGALDHITHDHLTLTEPAEDRRRVVQRLGARQLLDRLRALAGVGQLHAIDP